MNNIIYDNKIITPEYNIWKYYYDFIKKLNGRDCVKFALFCAKIANNNSKESNDRIELVEKWLVDEKSVSREELLNAYSSGKTVDAAADAAYNAYHVYNAYTDYVANAAWYTASTVAYAAYASIYNTTYNVVKVDKINKYLQVLIRKTKQFQNNKILEQISKIDVDKLELVDWNMITDIMLEDYNIIHEFSYEDIFSKRCLIELLRREYT